MSELTRLPKLLRDKRDVIVEASGFTDVAKFNAERWRSTLTKEPELEELLNRYPDGIGRAELRTLGEEARDGKVGTSYRRLFFATMLWGYGDRPYGPYRVTEMLSGDVRLTDGLLQETAQLVKQGDHAEALRRLRAPWLGVSFATKYLYSVGLAHELRPPPLVLDLLVAEELADLARTEGFDCTQYVRVYNRQIIRSGSAYQHYTQLLDAWGEKLGCPADRVEYFLFKQGRDRRKRRSSRAESETVTNSERDPKPFPAEDAVVDAVNAWLDREGFSFEQRNYVDVVAREPKTGRLWIIEAKGETSDPGLDFRTCLGQIVTAMHGPAALYAVAIPATKSYHQLCEGISDYVRRRLELHWILVGRAGRVWLVAPDEPLPNEAFVGEPT